MQLTGAAQHNQDVHGSEQQDEDLDQSEEREVLLALDGDMDASDVSSFFLFPNNIILIFAR